MKLKKIASLALAGIMAVSMLAGCKSNPADPENPTNPETTTGIVAAMNNGQSATNKIKVTFSSDASVEAGMTAALKALGDSAATTNANTLTELVASRTGITTDVGMSIVSDPDDETDGNLDDADKVDGKVITGLTVFRVDDVLTETAAERKAVSQIDAIIANLPDTTFVDNKTSAGTGNGEKYADYSYTGTINMVSVENSNGTTNYYVGYTITRTATVSTFEK